MGQSHSQRCGGADAVSQANPRAMGSVLEQDEPRAGEQRARQKRGREESLQEPARRTAQRLRGEASAHALTIPDSVETETCQGWGDTSQRRSESLSEQALPQLASEAVIPETELVQAATNGCQRSASSSGQAWPGIVEQLSSSGASPALDQLPSATTAPDVQPLDETTKGSVRLLRRKRLRHKTLVRDGADRHPFTNASSSGSQGTQVAVNEQSPESSTRSLQRRRCSGTSPIPSAPKSGTTRNISCATTPSGVAGEATGSDPSSSNDGLQAVAAADREPARRARSRTSAEEVRESRSSARRAHAGLQLARLRIRVRAGSSASSNVAPAREGASPDGHLRSRQLDDGLSVEDFTDFLSEGSPRYVSPPRTPPGLHDRLDEQPVEQASTPVATDTQTTSSSSVSLGRAVRTHQMLQDEANARLSRLQGLLTQLNDLYSRESSARVLPRVGARLLSDPDDLPPVPDLLPAVSNEASRVYEADNVASEAVRRSPRLQAVLARVRAREEAEQGSNGATTRQAERLALIRSAFEVARERRAAGRQPQRSGQSTSEGERSADAADSSGGAQAAAASSASDTSLELLRRHQQVLQSLMALRSMASLLEGPRGMSQEAIDSMTLTVTLNEKPNSGAEGQCGGNDLAQHCCMVCLEEFVEGDVLRVLPCFHRYHRECVDKWLHSNCLCPVCKHNVSHTSPGNAAGDDVLAPSTPQIANVD